MNYTIGEIFRLGLLKNHKGEPYKDKGTVSKALSKLPYTTKKTAWGSAKYFSIKDIESYNKDRLIQ